MKFIIFHCVVDTTEWANNVPPRGLHDDRLNVDQSIAITEVRKSVGANYDV